MKHLTTRQKPGAPAAPSKDLQGEGNYDAARRYDADAQRFVKSGRVPRAAREAVPQTPDEATEMKDAEAVGRSHARK